MANPIVLIVLIPLAAGLINLLLPIGLRKLVTLLSVSFGVYCVYGIFTQTPEPVSLFGLAVASADKTSLFALIFLQLLSLLILVFSLSGVEKDIAKPFFVLYPLTLAFCNGAVVSRHALAFLIFWSLSGLTLYGFALLGRGPGTPAAAKKTFILVGGSDAFLILGVALLAFRTGSWTLAGPSVAVSGGAAGAFVCLLLAVLAKAGGFPFHTWVPDFSRDAPIESAALLPASLDKILGIYLLVRMMTVIFRTGLFIHLAIITLGALTVITAVMMAMVQHNGRRLLGYHAVSQVGYMIMGVGSGSALALAGGLFHLVNNALYKSSLFLSLGSVEKRTGSSNLDELGGLAKVMPATFLMALIGSLSISGIPPFNGFFSKWMIYQGLLEQTAAPNLAAGYKIWLLACLILAVFGSALTLASFLKLLHAVFLGKRPERFNSVKEAPVNQWVATGSLALLCLVFGVFAREIPLRLFVRPVLEENGLAVGAASGLYNPQVILILFAGAFLTGLIIYLLTRKVRFDDVYLGGRRPAESFRIVGTEFYNEIKTMKPLQTFYAWAEKKYFDVYDLGARATFSVAHGLQKVHSGLLPLYVLFIVLGLLAFLTLSL
jgi:multicomponent Na+:H+ antiporter subunit A